MTEKELREFEKGRRQICNLDGPTALNQNLNYTIDNLAILETILATQAIIFQHLFPENTKEEHHARFKEKTEQFKAEIIIDMIKNVG